MKTKTLLITALLAAGMTLTVSAREYHDILKSKNIKVGIRVRDGVYDSAKKKGFHHDLINFFAIENNNITVELIVKTQMDEYFNQNIFKECDIVVDNITITDERKQKMDFVTIHPVKEVLVTMPEASAIKKLFSLRKETIVVAKDCTYYKSIKFIEDNSIYKGRFKYFFSATPQAQMQDLRDGKGTVTILDANLALLFVQNRKQITHTTISEEGQIGWGVSKGTPLLLKKVQQFIDDSKKNGLFDRVWSTHFPISYAEYLYIIQTDDADKEELAEDEREKLLREVEEQRIRAESEQENMSEEDRLRLEQEASAEAPAP